MLPLIMSLLNMDLYSELAEQFQTKLAWSDPRASFGLVIKNISLSLSFFPLKKFFFKSLRECSSASVYYLIYSAFSCYFFPDEDELH